MKRFIKKSATIHVTVLILIIVWPSIFHRKYKQKMLPVHTVELISPEQLKASPKKIDIPKPKPKKSKPKPKPKKKKSPVKKKRHVLKPTVKKLKTPTLEEKLSKRIKNTKEPVVKSKPEPVKEISSYIPQLKATITNQEDFPFQWYLSFIQGKISSCWHQPQMVIAKQYISMISFTILKDGSVRNIKVKRSSGITNFDKSAIQAVEQAQPLPPLPPSYKHEQLVVNVEFRLE